MTRRIIARLSADRLDELATIAGRPRRSHARRPVRLPAGTLWIIAGAVLGGCVQDMTILLLSTRRDGRSLGQMARDELGPLALRGAHRHAVDHDHSDRGAGLVVVNAMKHSPWATSTVFATIPIAILVGFYLRRWRPGRCSKLPPGSALVLFAVVGGGWIDGNPTLRAVFDYPALPLAGFVIVYGWLARSFPCGCCWHRVTTFRRFSSWVPSRRWPSRSC